MKNRKQKAKIYEEKYSHIERTDHVRLNNMINQYNYNTDPKKSKLEYTINNMKSQLTFEEVMFILYEEPEGSPRPRFRLINRKNLGNMALANNAFVHVYSPVASGDSKYMKKLTDNEIVELNQLINTPCIFQVDAYFKIPTCFNQKEKILAEQKLIRPISKPDWDNIGKKYSDMMNGNIWIDDSYVVSGIVNKWYSSLPRVEIKIKYLNKLYNKYQYKSTLNKINEGDQLDYYKEE